MRVKLSLESDFAVDIPKYSGKPTVKVFLNGSAYFCKEDTCFPSDINLLVNVHYADEETENQSCDFSYHVKEV